MYILSVLNFQIIYSLYGLNILKKRWTGCYGDHRDVNRGNQSLSLRVSQNDIDFGCLWYRSWYWLFVIHILILVVCDTDLDISCLWYRSSPDRASTSTMASFAHSLVFLPLPSRRSRFKGACNAQRNRAKGGGGCKNPIPAQVPKSVAQPQISSICCGNPASQIVELRNYYSGFIPALSPTFISLLSEHCLLSVQFLAGY